MPTITNEIDLILQAATTRFPPTDDRALLLGCSAPGGFKVATNGTPTPAAIVFTPILIGMTGTVSYSLAGGLALTYNGNEGTLSFASMTANSGTVTVNLTVDGIAYSRSITISKLFDGATGGATYTWVKYADSAAGAGLSDDPTGKAYIGLAYNKSSATESTTASDYAWSLIRGADGAPGNQGVPGAPGVDGQPTYTWIKYADVADGTGLYDTPNANTAYIGLAANKTVQAESTVKTDYVWSKFRGDQGVPGNNGANGARGAGNFYVAGSSWSDLVADIATPGDTVLDDQVTISDGTATYTKRWNGSAWVVPGAYLAGSLFVENSITAAKINTNGLVVRAPDGTPIVGIGVPLNPAYAAPGTKNSDLVPSINSAATTANDDNSIRTPIGGKYVATGQTSVTGALKIRLPQSWTGTMMRFTVDIYEYIAGYSCTVEIAGYNYEAGGWYNVSARVVGGSNVEYPVYFGHDGTKCCVWIGNANETWAYPQVQVRDFFGGYLNAERAKWESGWIIGFDTVAATNVTGQVLDTYPAADWRKTVGPGRPQDNSTRGAPADTLVGNSLAQNVDLWAQQGANAWNAIPGVNNAIADRLSKTGNEEISGQKSLTSQYALLVGTVNDGIIYGSTGLYGRKAGSTTLSIGADGTAIFAGSLLSASGSFGTVSIAPGGSLKIGQTDYNTGTGAFLGFHAGIPKFSLGVAGGSSIRWDGTQVLIDNPTISRPAFTIARTTSETYYTVGRTGSTAFASFPVAPANAVGTVIYDWSVAGGTNGTGGGVRITGTTGSTSSVNLTALGNTISAPATYSYYITCRAVAGDGRAHTLTFTITLEFT